MKLIAAFCLVTLVSISVKAQLTREYLDVHKFKAKLSEVKGAVLLDVRTPGEWKQGFIEGAVLIDYNHADFKKKIDALDKSKPYFIYCAVGGRSSKTVDLMKDMGFTKLYHLNGGFDAWKAARLPVKKN